VERKVEETGTEIGGDVDAVGCGKHSGRARWQLGLRADSPEGEIARQHH